MRPVIIAFIFGALWTVTAHAQTAEFTPGPRMIRALEQLSHEYLKMDHALRMTSKQKRAMSEVIQSFKREIWLKEAVLLGMFAELDEKRRYGLLQGNEYQTTNVLTAAIETDELNLLIHTLTKLEAILTEQQRSRLQQLGPSALTFRVPQGATTQIALSSLEGIGQVYNRYRYQLRLTDSQAIALRALLEAARAELLRMGTPIDINRTEAYDLLKESLVDPETVRIKMQKTGDMEGVLFNKLFEVSNQVKDLLTPEQRATLRQLKQGRHAGALEHRPGRSAHMTSFNPHTGDALNHFRFFLDQIEELGLTREQVGALVALKNQTKKERLLYHAKLKGMELELLNLVTTREPGTKASAETLQEKIVQLEQVRAKDTRLQIRGYLKAQEVLTETQQRRSKPLRALSLTF